MEPTRQLIARTIPGTLWPSGRIENDTGAHRGERSAPGERLQMEPTRQLITMNHTWHIVVK
ncbi:hypothetical protein [Vibrio fluvialis]|uniref:hypothetical protein n=1 Tax=Vibrio fluvialis TaxID=676 RepID=UPI00399A016F